MNSCPETYLLRGLLDETLPAAERVEIERHVEDCTLCEGVLENLTSAETAFLGEPLPDAVPDADEGRDHGPYDHRFRIRRRFDGGGQGDLFIAWDQELEREVALKRIKEQHAEDWWRRGELIREALITGRLEHPGIVPVYGLGFDGEGQSYYAMRLVRSLVGRDSRGHTLQDAIAEFHAGRPEWTLRKLLDRFIAVCNTIQYAHDQGVLHCDLKPLNVILGPYGETLVLDWGAARAIVEPSAEAHPPGHAGSNGHPREGDKSPWWQDGGFHLTPAYASPEQLAGRARELRQSSDVYSLGAILCCILTGHGPRRASSSLEGAEDLRTGPRPADARTGPRPDWQTKDVPGPLAGICSKALEVDPADRYPSARDLAEDVGHWLADEPVSAYRENLLDRLLRVARRHRAWTQAGAAALVLVTVVSLAGFLMVNGARREAVRLSSEMAQDRAMAHFEQGDAQRGVLWLGRSLELLPGGRNDFRRLNLAGWHRRMCTLKDFRALGGATEILASDPGGRYLLGTDAGGHAMLCSLESGAAVGLPLSPAEARTSVFSPDGTMLLTGDETGEVRLWETSGAPASGG
ncbi:MAG: serine/threonine-protein kinase [Isosphaeraceae bacterium]